METRFLPHLFVFLYFLIKEIIKVKVAPPLRSVLSPLQFTFWNNTEVRKMTVLIEFG
jgi:hypothetical protein